MVDTHIYYTLLGMTYGINSTEAIAQPLDCQLQIEAGGKLLEEKAHNNNGGVNGEAVPQKGYEQGPGYL